MASSLQSHTAYSGFIYQLLAERVTVEKNTIAVYTVGQTVGIIRGEIRFYSGHVLRIFEQIDFMTQQILTYFYEVRLNNEPLWWYDPMPHPHIPELQSTHPHHKHVPPDIKHHRIPAPGLTFNGPNLDYLIVEVEAM